MLIKSANKAYHQGNKAAKYAVAYGCVNSRDLMSLLKQSSPYKGPYDPSIEYAEFERGFTDYITERFCGPVAKAELCRFHDLREAKSAALLLSGAAAEGVFYEVSDDGEYVSPRYEIVVMPRLGEPVSKGFNGDYYPCGRISKISSSGRRIQTDTGVVFYRAKDSRQRWRSGGTWSMVRGWLYRQNPSF